ncbi:hypothetical protein PLICRDRAFT_153462 [Plicaturopsis crispa FD-325 SS-3]|nr:hypothetical protein PLICRDRAFT_153462 [Plicaturopsis crispa FD-325 SS-3]
MVSSKVVLVTGCSRGGIGFHLCEQFAEQGCKVYATSRKVESVEGFTHANIEKLALDVTSDESVLAAVQTVLQKEGKIDIVVNNAGILISIGAMIDIPIEHVKQTFDTNTFSALRVAKAVIPSMAARKSGLIINIGSIVGNTPTPWDGIYAASKSALHTITEVLWMECKPFNIDVMLVAPGAVKSHISHHHNSLHCHYTLPPDSLYSGYFEQIRARVNLSQTGGAMDTDVFAERVAAKALASKPPVYVTLGGSAWVFGVLRWVPRVWVLGYMWRRFSRKP